MKTKKELNVSNYEVRKYSQRSLIEERKMLDDSNINVSMHLQKSLFDETKMLESSNIFVREIFVKSEEGITLLLDASNYSRKFVISFYHYDHGINKISYWGGSGTTRNFNVSTKELFSIMKQLNVDVNNFSYFSTCISWMYFNCCI